MMPLRCYRCTRIITPEEQADEQATTWLEGRGWVHRSHFLEDRYGNPAPHHWHTEPKEECPEVEEAP